MLPNWGCLAVAHCAVALTCPTIATTITHKITASLTNSRHFCKEGGLTMQTKNIILLGLTLFSFAAALKSGSFADSDKKPAEVTDARVSADASVGANWMI